MPELVHIPVWPIKGNNAVISGSGVQTRQYGYLLASTLILVACLLPLDPFIIIINPSSITYLNLRNPRKINPGFSFLDLSRYHPAKRVQPKNLNQVLHNSHIMGIFLNKPHSFLILFPKQPKRSSLHILNSAQIGASHK